MYLIPYIRVGRAITMCQLLSTCSLFHVSTSSSIAISEIISVCGPLLNPNLFNKNINLYLAILCQPYFLQYYFDWYTSKEKKYYNLELITMIIFFIINK